MTPSEKKQIDDELSFLKMCNADVSNGFMSEDVMNYKQMFPVISELCFNGTGLLAGDEFDIWIGNELSTPKDEEIESVLTRTGRVYKVGSLWYEHLSWRDCIRIKDIVGYRKKG